MKDDDNDYEKITLSNEASLDTLLPNPFSDPLDDNNYLPASTNSKKSKPIVVTDTDRKKSRIPIPHWRAEGI